jgi:hypothetical protein
VSRDCGRPAKLAAHRPPWYNDFLINPHNYQHSRDALMSAARKFNRILFGAVRPSSVQSAAVAVFAIAAVVRGGAFADDPADLSKLAQKLLDKSTPRKERDDLVRANVDHAGKLVTLMTADLKPEDSEEEYRRMGTIWFVAISAGRENKTPVLRELLDASLPRLDQPLRDWQAVVIGGGIGSGVSELYVFPRARVAELIKDNKDLTERWQRVLPLASAMADNEKVHVNTRYDALRLIALDDWERRGAQLQKYLAQGVPTFLQQAAVEGIADVDRPESAEVLLASLPNLAPRNHAFVILGLLWNDQRFAALQTAVDQGKIKVTSLNESQKRALREHKNELVRARAAKLLGST